MDPFSVFGGRIAVFDGAMGTMLQNAGLAPGEAPEILNYRNAQAVEEVHRAYISAGADVITTNTFGANRIKLERVGLGVAETYKKAVAIARAAAGKAGRKIIVAADVGPTGVLLPPLGDADFEKAVSVYAECAKAAEAAGADILLFETMSNLYECKAAVIAARENCSLPVAVSVTFDEGGRMLTGADAECAAVYLSGLGADAIGVNCGLGPDAIFPIAKIICENCGTPVFVNANAGMPVISGGKTYYRETPERFFAFAKDLAAIGVNAVGGCCGTDPKHIESVKKALDGALALKRGNKPLAVCSGTKVYRFGEKTAVIGERLNPTGKKLLKAALNSGDTAYVMREASSQESAGADLLDVNAGLPGIDEPKVLCDMIRAVQSVCDLPLQIDSASPEALARAVRIYNGVPVINSVSGKEEVLKDVLPIMKKYGGAAVALLLDDGGIPQSPEGRIAIADKIITRAESEGIDSSRLIFDALTMTVATDKNNGETTLECVEKLAKTGRMTVLGVSNISYGMPDRDRINASFLGAAIDKGLTAAIINPSSPHTNAVFASPSPHGEFRFEFAEEDTAYALPSYGEKAITLIEAIRRGLPSEAGTAAKAELESGKKPLEVIDGSIIPALNALGDDYEQKRVFLPRLLSGAEAAKAAFGAISLAVGDGNNEGAPTVVFATVRGDIHDIGKNIVVTLLRNYGFNVVDLGKDVPPETVLEAAKDSGAYLVGLSALMTTTLPAMSETVELIHRELPKVKVMVGGAVLTQEYADAMNADFYGSDAISAVRYAEKLRDRK
ncbi:MAG: homocysteine S-methyltransferase family protein [Clostridia bacterium]|nr:homocysteine S-methyltransferase family protein [Clostridia bacterium]